jgi:hypothetical protein
VSLIEIRSGLRKLEFEGSAAERSADSEERALVEFVCEAPLPEAEAVRIELGARGGVLRELSGCPELVETKALKAGKREYLYRLRGRIAASPDSGGCDSRPRKHIDAR